MSFPNTSTPLRPTTKARWQVPKRRHPSGAMEYYLEGELKDRFCSLYPIHSTRRIMQWFGISYSTCTRFRREFGLQKDMTAIRKELARDIKRICEKNGYYDSIRGVPPSEACRAAASKKRAEGFHPLKHLKATNPRKYRRVVKRQTEHMAQLRESDRRRLLFGLEPRTRLVKPNTLSRKASVQKHSMKEKNNYFSVREHPDWICYDNETRRSPRREARAILYGLKVVEGESVTEQS